jgi:ABC-type nickel/cobalt efflux system permease component RcnA
MVVALANGMMARGLLVTLSMALGMTATVALLAAARDPVSPMVAHLTCVPRRPVDRSVRALEIAGAAAVALVGRLLLSAELA